MRMVQQVSKKGEVNALSTAFVREDNEAVAARRARGGEPFGDRSTEPLVYIPSPHALGLPRRPEGPHASSAAAQEAAERVAFDEWLQSVHDRFPPAHLSPFEHNLEVWRQLWRCVERSDIICLVADVRNPLLHIPQALYEYCCEKLFDERPEGGGGGGGGAGEGEYGSAPAFTSSSSSSSRLSSN